jgi:hypothetical protein
MLVAKLPNGAAIILLFLAIAVGAPTTDISGQWSFVLTMDDSPQVERLMTLQQDGDKLSGSYKGGLGVQTVTGKLTGNHLVLNATVELGMRTLVGTYDGTLESATRMKGTLVFREGEKQLSSGTWTSVKTN